jgi:endonuclease/exonuclease/phosphatase family metal-dependent hydrolase
MCIICRFLDLRTKQVFFVANTHLDHESVRARELGLCLIMERLERAALGCPTVLCGDFNDCPEAECIAKPTARGPLRMRDALYTYDSSLSKVATFHGFSGDTRNPDLHIDYIFVSQQWHVHRAHIDTAKDPATSLWPSDHFLILADLELEIELTAARQ